MPSLHDIQKRTGVPMRHLRALYAADLLKADPPDEFLETFARSMQSGHALSVAQALYVLSRDDLPPELQRYGERIDAGMYDLGDIARDAAPWSIAQAIENAAENPDDLNKLAQWARSLLDALPRGRTVSHQWLSVRLLYNVPAVHRDRALTRWHRVSRLLREHSLLAFAWRREHGKIVYLKPKPLDI